MEKPVFSPFCISERLFQKFKSHANGPFGKKVHLH